MSDKQQEESVLEITSEVRFIVPQQLRRFLEKEKALEQYLVALLRYRRDVRGLKCFFDRHRDRGYWIAGAFIWNGTPQGYDYWQALSRKWDIHKDSRDLHTSSFYIATTLDNAGAHARVTARLKELGAELTYDWTTHGPVHERSKGEIGRVAEDELTGVVYADVVIVLMPGGRGTHVELGAALGEGKPVILCSKDPVDHANAPGTCAFYHHPQITHVMSEDELVETFKREYCK